MRSTKTAWAVTAVVILLCAVLGCNRSLAALRSQTAKLMVTRDADGYCIATDCQDMVNVARNLVTVAQKYLPADTPEFKHVEFYCNQMDQAGTDAGMRMYAAQFLNKTAEDITAKLEEAGELSEKDAGYLSGFDTDLDAAMARMEKDPYNDAARAFNKIEGSFPANVLGFLVGPLDCFEF